MDRSLLSGEGGGLITISGALREVAYTTVLFVYKRARITAQKKTGKWKSLS